MQSRERNNLEWQRIEQLGGLLQLALDSIRENQPSLFAELPSEVLEGVVHAFKTLNAGYRADFRAGVGDEMALVVDFKGMMPPVPGVPAETIAEQTIPRFLVARPVTNRTSLSDAAEV